MKYRDLIGFSKPKKKIIKENIKSKEKRNLVLENLKEEMNEWKMFPTSNSPTPFKKPLQEVGMSTELKAYTSKIEQDYEKYWNSVKDLEKFLIKRKLKKPANEIHRKYMKLVLGFQSWFRAWIRKLL